MRDKLALRARREGYRARSVYKLIELDRKYKILKKNDFVLDIGAAPGSWMQFASKIVGVGGFVLGVDKIKIENVRDNSKSLKLDINRKDAVDRIKEYFSKVDVVLCDISPKTSGIRDQEESVELSDRAFEVSRKFLKKDGNFLCKVFQGGDFESFYRKVGKHFKMFKSTKPKSSKKGSKEIYIVGLGYK